MKIMETNCDFITRFGMKWNMEIEIMGTLKKRPSATSRKRVNK